MRSLRDRAPYHSRAPLPFLACVTLLAAGCIAPAGSLEDSAVEESPDAFVDLAEGVRALAEAVLTGEPVRVTTLPVGLVSGWSATREFEVELQASAVYDPATAWALIRNESVTPPFFGVAEGRVVGVADSEVRITWTQEWARGIVLVDKTLHFIFIGEPPERGPPLIYHLPGSANPSSDGAHPAHLHDHDEAECNSFEPTRLLPLHGKFALNPQGRFEGTPYSLRVIVDGDAFFAEKYGEDAFPMLVAQMNDVDAVFSREIGLRIEVVGTHLHPDTESLDPEGSLLYVRQRLAEYWNDRLDLERDLVHLFTGRNQAGAVAACVGGVGDPRSAYTITPSLYGDRDANSALLVLAHEIGHIMSAHHHFANMVEGVGTTILHHSYLPGNRPFFSTLSKAAIRGWAELHLEPAATEG